MTRSTSAQTFAADAVPGRFRTLQYEPVAGDGWYHVLFGHVPRYQMEFILRPELPWRKFRPQHFAHLGPQIKFLTPSAGQSFALAIGNLSSNDTQHIPGRGGLSILVSTRVSDLRDHAQRESPVFAHGLIAIDEPLQIAEMTRVVSEFTHHVLTDGLRFYRNYYTSGDAGNFERVHGYIRSLRDLNQNADSADPVAEGTDDAFVQYVRNDPPLYNHIFIDCRRADQASIIALAARLGVLLYRSNLKWSLVTTGSEPFEVRQHNGVDFGIGVRLLCDGVPDDAIERYVRDASEQSKVALLDYGDLPDEDLLLVSRLFGVERAASSGAVSGQLADHRSAPQLLPGAEGPPPAGLVRQVDGDWGEPLPMGVAPKDTDRDLTIVSPPTPGMERAVHQAVPAPSPSLPSPAAVGPVSPSPSPQRRGLWLGLGLVLGCGLGTALTWGALSGALGLPGSRSQLRGSARSPGPSPASRSPNAVRAMASDGRRELLPPPDSASADSPPAPVPPPTGDEPEEPSSESLEARQALVSTVQPQALQYKRQAQRFADFVKAETSGQFKKPAPYQRLSESTSQLQQQISQFDFLASVIVVKGNVHRMIELADSYCDLRASYQQAEAAARRVDFPSGAPPREAKARAGR
ncbi:MAG TPA: hypothetical protein PKI03_00890 [Pseudomonadota bacterium]|nr:hypothetical protein [Pseudomonadota bacterium]